MSADRSEFLPTATLTFPEVFAQHLRDARGTVCFTEVIAKGRELESVPYTFAELDARARAASRVLRSHAVAHGDRVVLCIERPDRFFVWFLAAERIGAIPVPLPSLGTLDAPAAFRERVEAVCADCSPRVIVLDDDGESPAREALSRGTSIVVADIGAGVDVDASDVPDAVPKMSDAAFLQYTSGSTGRPKGVIVTHGNLVANFRAISEVCEFGPDERALSWLPLYHDMGLIGGFLIGIYMRIAIFTMRPKAFLHRPDSWLRAISQHRATYTVAPNFAYSLIGRKLPESALRGLDLSSLRLAFNGAEPIDRPTVDAFVSKLAPYGLRANVMYPVYGLAECTLAVAFPKPGSVTRFDAIDRDALQARSESVVSESPERSLAVISVGSAIPGHSVRILALDAERELPERSVGEIAVSGPSVSPGYFGHAPREEGALRTGDLGYSADGQLFIVDRIKDLVILRGRNYAPSDIERTVARVSGVTRGSIVAFSCPGEDGTESLTVIAALDPTSMRGVSQIMGDVRRQLVETFSITNADVRIVAPGSIPKTSSGKVKRRACRELYLQGVLREVEGVAMRAGFVADRMRTRIGVLLADRD